MTKLSYWQRRFLRIKANQLQNTEDYEKALQTELNGLYREIHQELQSWYTKYANNDGLTSDRAKKALEGIKTKHWQMSLKEFEAKAKSGGFDQELDREYYSSRIARLQLLETQLQNWATDFAMSETNHLQNALKDQYQDTYMRTIFNTQIATAKLTSNFARFNEDQLRYVVSKPWAGDGKDFSDRIWKNYREEMPSQLMNVMMKGVLLGYSPQRLSQQLHERFSDIKRNNIHRLVVTEMGHVAEEATAKAYEESDIEQYEYMATLESHTCAVCGHLDGEIFKVSERKLGVNYPLMHSRCRCTTVPYIAGLPDTSERWMRDPETGKGKLIKNMKFDEWQHEYAPERLIKPYSPDLMAKGRVFDIGNGKIRTHRIKNENYSIWAQKNSQRTRSTIQMLDSNLPKIKGYDLPEFAIVDAKSLKTENGGIGLAGYDHTSDTLFISNDMHSEQSVFKALSDGYFASQDFKDILIHELTHKKHWDTAKYMYNSSPKKYNSVIEAKQVLDEPIRSYVQMQQVADPRYLSKISTNARFGFSQGGSINEVVAEVMVINKNLSDERLLSLVKELLNNGNYG